MYSRDRISSFAGSRSASEQDNETQCDKHAHTIQVTKLAAVVYCKPLERKVSVVAPL